MRQSIRALGWAVTISTLLLIVFVATAVYSMFQTVLMQQGIGLGGFQTSFSNDRLILTVPININNTGWYDITDFNMATTLKDFSGATLAANTTEIDIIKKGSPQSRTHELSLRLSEILSEKTYLLFNDTEFGIDFSVGFKYAYAFGFELAVMNTSIPWGAPLYGLRLKGISQPISNSTHLLIDVMLELENHSFLDADGELHLEVYNTLERCIGSGRGLVHVPSNSRLSRPIEVTIAMENPSDFNGKGYVKVSLEVPIIDGSLDLGRVNYG